MLSSSTASSMGRILANQKVAPLSILEPKYFVPRAERSESRPLFQVDAATGLRLQRANRRDVSRDLNFTSRHWQQHKDVWRHWRHLRQTLNSGPFQRLLFPDLFVNGSIASALTYYNMFVAEAGAELWMDGAAMAGATTAVGLMAGFRVHASYGRFDEARKFWGEVNNAARDLAGNALMWLEMDHQKHRMLNLIKAFPISLQWHLNEKGGHYRISKNDPQHKERIDIEFYSEMLEIFESEDDEDFSRIIQANRNGLNVPLVIASGMRQTIAYNRPYADAIYNREMDEQVQRLVGCLGMCERVLRTPLPVCFTRHTSRLFYIWSNLLPFAMYPALGMATVPASLMVSWAVLGIEDVGVQLEEPFNMLPMRQYSEGMYAGVNDIRDSYVLEYPDIQTTLDSNMTESSQDEKYAMSDAMFNGAQGISEPLDGAAEIVDSDSDNDDDEKDSLRSA